MASEKSLVVCPSSSVMGTFPIRSGEAKQGACMLSKSVSWSLVSRCHGQDSSVVICCYVLSVVVVIFLKYINKLFAA